MNEHRSRLRRFAAPGLLLVGSTIFVLAAAEGLARLVALPPVAEPSFQLPDRSQRKDGLEELTLWQMIRPNVRGRVKGALYTTNRWGFRGPEVEELPPVDVFRIVVVGDSVVMGEGVPDEQTYARLLEKQLNSTSSDRRLEVLNLGVSGLSFPHVVRRVERFALRFHPDLLIYGWTINDIEGPDYRASGPLASYQARYRRFEASPSYLLRAMWPRWISVVDTVVQPAGSYPADLRFNYFENDEAWRVFPEGFDRLAELGEEHGFCVEVFLHTQLFGLRFTHPFRSIYERVERTAVEHGLSATNSFPVFAGRDEAALTLSADDPHPNAEGHRLLARALADGLRTLPASCWER